MSTLELSREFEAYLVTRTTMLVYAAEHDLCWQVYDARASGSKEITDPAICAEWKRLWNALAAAQALLSADEMERIHDTRDFCQLTGHFRHRRDRGRPRWVCVSCLCTFDADPWTDQILPVALNVHGGYGLRMPGATIPDSSER